MAEKAADDTERRAPEALDAGGRIERRRQRRDVEASPDWEMIVLQRMTERVNSLSGESAPGTGTARDGNWEEAALLTLQRRMKDLQAK